MTAPAEPRSLRTLVVSGFAWSLGAMALVQVARIGFAIALARFLTPHEYGLAGMALVFSMLVMAFMDLGLGAGLVQRREITQQDCSTVFWTCVAVGATLSAGGVLASGPLAAFYGEPDVQPLFAILSVSFVIGSLGATHVALFQRELNFRAISIRVTVSTLLGGAVGVAMAAAGYGAWALIGQALVTAIASSALLWASLPWRPSFTYSLASLRDLGTFGIKVFGVRVLDYLRTNGDKLLVGRTLGSAPLGLYTVAYNIHLLPLSRFMIAVQDTLLPAFSRLQDERERLATIWLRVNRAIAAFLFPGLAGLIVLAPELVEILLGPRWSGVAPLLQILVTSVIVVSISSLGTQVLMALDRTSTLLRFSVAETVLLVAAIAVGVHWGITGVAVAYSVVHIVSRLYFAKLTTRAVEIPLTRFAGVLVGVSQATAIMVVIIVSMKFVLLQGEVAAWIRLCTLTLVGATVYVPSCLWREPALREELHLLRRRGLSAPAPAPAPVVAR